MISGAKTFTSGPAPRWLVALLLCAAGNGAWAFDLAELMALLARQKGGEAQFTEQRYVKGLDGPLTAAGTLRFAAPDRLERRTLQPRAESMVVEGNTVTLARGGRTRTLALDSAPELLGLVEAMRGTLAGDAAVLQRHFRTTLAGSAADWSLELLPRDDRLAAQVQNLRIAGRAGELRSVELDFRNGDRAVTTVVPAPAAASASPSPSVSPAGRP